MKIYDPYCIDENLPLAALNRRKTKVLKTVPVLIITENKLGHFSKKVSSALIRGLSKLEGIW